MSEVPCRAGLGGRGHGCGQCAAEGLGILELGLAGDVGSVVKLTTLTTTHWVSATVTTFPVPILLSFGGGPQQGHL
jgi:hypothetical protein